MISEKKIKKRLIFPLSLQKNQKEIILQSPHYKMIKKRLVYSIIMIIFAAKTNHDMIITTADKIRAQIKLHGKTQTEVAGLLGVLPTNLTRTINNPRVTLADLNKIADAIGCNVAEFFVDDYTPPQPPTLTCPHCGKPIEVHLK